MNFTVCVTKPNFINIDAVSAEEAVVKVRTMLQESGQLKETDPVTFEVVHETVFDEATGCYRAVN